MLQCVKKLPSLLLSLCQLSLAGVRRSPRGERLRRVGPDTQTPSSNRLGWFLGFFLWLTRGLGHFSSPGFSHTTQIICQVNNKGMPLYGHVIDNGFGIKYFFQRSVWNVPLSNYYF